MSKLTAEENLTIYQDKIVPELKSQIEALERRCEDLKKEI